ncbi:MAG: oligosaccharide flippase family protein [Isosphaeraceae bacterium]|nr:oligosaccharide flippase family protein [Isosphaeraceae bacterium]
MSIVVEGSPRRVSAKNSTGRAGLLGLGWTSSAQFVGMFIKLGSNLILTRLLAPEVYGLFGTAMAIVTTLEWLSDLGVQPALVRHPEGDRSDYLNTGWWMNLWRGLGLSAVMAALSQPLATAYGQPGLAAVIAVLALKPFIYAFRSPGMPLLRRSLNYRALFVDEVVQTVVATAVSLALAWYTRSVWSIVGGTIAGSAVSSVLSYILCPISPRWSWDRSAADEISKFGRAVFLNTMVMAVWLNLDRLLGLRLVGDHEMGLYTVAWNLAAVVEGLMTRGCDVYFSMLSRFHDVDSRRRRHESISNKVIFVGMPALAVGVIASPFATSVLYDQRYAGAGVLLGLMVARLMVRFLGQMQFQYLLASAHIGVGTKAYLVAMLVQASILIPLTNALGVVGMACSSLISTAVLTGFQTWMLERRGVASGRHFLWTSAIATSALIVLLYFRSAT